MSLNNLRPPRGARRDRKRVGRGPGSGHGKTASRGSKGAKSRSGFRFKRGFEGGQMPLHRRVPKRGFHNPFRVEYAVVNVGQISAYAEAGRLGDTKPPTVNAETLAQAGLIRGDGKPLKVLGQGDVATKLFVAADAFSASARTKIEAAGGNVLVLAPEKPRAEEKEPKAKKPKPAQADAGEETTQAESPKAQSDVQPEATEAVSDSSESAES